MPIQFFGQPGLDPVMPERPINVMFLVSVRDLGECDRNGMVVSTPEGERYMDGIIDFLYKSGLVRSYVRIVGMVTDDTEHELRDYTTIPFREKDWLFKREGVPGGSDVVVDLQVRNILSTFRILPKNDIDGRRQAKLRFEQAVKEFMTGKQADVLISDHYMARIEHLHRWFPGRVLNIHPAVTLVGHPFCFRGPTPTADAIKLAQKNGSHVCTGATLHLVDDEIDHGPIIAYAADTPVFPSDQPQWLRYRNYQKCKGPVFVAGLRHYIMNIFPYLDQLDLTKLVPV